MSQQYEKLDDQIINAINERRNPLYDKSANVEAERIAEETGREAYRIIDVRLQALRKAGKIRHFTKGESNGKGGWRVAA